MPSREKPFDKTLKKVFDIIETKPKDGALAVQEPGRAELAAQERPPVVEDVHSRQDEAGNPPKRDSGAKDLIQRAAEEAENSVQNSSSLPVEGRPSQAHPLANI